MTGFFNKTIKFLKKHYQVVILMICAFFLWNNYNPKIRFFSDRIEKEYLLWYFDEKPLEKYSGPETPEWARKERLKIRFKHKQKLRDIKEKMHQEGYSWNKIHNIKKTAHEKAFKKYQSGKNGQEITNLLIS